MLHPHYAVVSAVDAAAPLPSLCVSQGRQQGSRSMRRAVAEVPGCVEVTKRACLAASNVLIRQLRRRRSLAHGRAR